MDSRLLKSLVVLLLSILTGSIAFGQFSKTDSTLVLKGGKLILSPATTSEAIRTLDRSADGVHVVVKLVRTPTVDDRKFLAQRGLVILKAIGHGAYIARMNKSFNAQDKKSANLIFNVAVFSREHRITPKLSDKQKTEKAYVIKPEEGTPYNYVVNADGTLNLTVQFYADVKEPIIRDLLKKYAKKFEKMSDEFWSVTIDRDAMLRLADEDAVQWIDAGPIPFLPGNDRTRRTIDVDSVQSFNTTTGIPLGLGGQGVDIGIFDNGVDQNHQDFTGRTLVTIAATGSTGTTQSHGTHVAGIALGDGRMSNQNDSWGNANGGTAFQWRGMAPQADLIEVSSGSGTNAATYLTSISTNGMDISNHSYGITMDGEYDAANVFVDQYIHGTATSGGATVPPRLAVFAAGNNGAAPQYFGGQLGYFSLFNQLKNALVVGNYDVGNNRISTSSSLGPAYDGRIKPDVVAPGSNIVSTGYCAACVNPATGVAAAHRDYYRTTSGTSMAAPAVTGMLGLVLQQWAATFSVNIDNSPPYPSTLRAIAIHTARDISSPVWFDNEDAPVRAFPGPDFVTGWGIVDAVAAVEAVSHKRIIQDSVVNTCDSKEYKFYVGPTNMSKIKATLCWDDEPAVANAGGTTTPLLINDLDLELVDPKGTVHYPWLLNQRTVNALGRTIANSAQTCGTAVTVETDVHPTLAPVYVGPGNAGNVNDPIQPGDLRPATFGKDHLNTVEVVEVQPTPGTWKAIVRGFNVNQGPQRFSLILPRSDRFFGPIDICQMYPRLCPIIVPVNFCKRYPFLCEPAVIDPGHLGPIIRFRHPLDRVIIQIDKICQYVINCPGCGGAGLCPGYDIRMGGMPDDFKIQVYDSDGELLFKDLRKSTTKGFTIKTEREKSYFMIVQPGSRTKIGKDYTLPMEVKSL